MTSTAVTADVRPRRSRAVVEPHRVLVVGGGTAGRAALAGLRDLGGDSLVLELLSPPRSSPRRPDPILGAADANTGEVDLQALCDDLGIALHRGAQSAVDQLTHRAHLSDGDTIAYDELLVASGAAPIAPYAGIRTLGIGALAGHFAALRPGKLSVIVPPGVAWTLPAYELALLAAHQLAIGVEILTAERQPLALFGERASAMVADLLARAGVDVLPRAVIPLGSDLPTLLDNAIALPLARGPAVGGLPAEGDGFLPVDAHGRVVGATAVHAAGDVTSRDVRGGGLAAQDGEIAAADIARSAGAVVATATLRVLRATITTNDGSVVHLRRALDGHDPGSASRWPLRPETDADPWRPGLWAAGLRP